MIPLLVVALGLIALIVGAELVVRYGAKLARRMGIPPIIIGLTVVSIGTSAPELAVGIDAVRSGAGSLAIGNIVGTNMVNLLLILGMSAAIRPIVMHAQTLKLDLPAMAAASVLLFLLSFDRALSVLDGVLLFVAALVYMALLVLFTRRESTRVLAEYEHEYPRQDVHGSRRWAVVEAALLALGIVVIVFGADWLVRGAVELAAAAGVSNALIGLTIVAIGTSAPELATTIVATIRDDRDIAVGNLIGSSIFNLTFILGASLFFAPGQVAVEPSLAYIDMPIMVLVSLLCVPVFLTGRRVTRVEGVLFVVAYAVYLTYLIVART
ncbi:calcium/sodium antiporter [Microbacterium gallinarum]|uniref:Calcium/sodium antiporter n=1 Tax=Microbacterium gallinarum TaxID=2762209 RepID=A0ABR8X3I1_9MICO|nr:calcium/sodium antiporter [Microbacterium gallinarum]MBD8023881.1 calcium/sodium antiporter [Microbacterium gallinarum]